MGPKRKGLEHIELGGAVLKGGVLIMERKENGLHNWPKQKKGGCKGITGKKGCIGLRMPPMYHNGLCPKEQPKP